MRSGRSTRREDLMELLSVLTRVSKYADLSYKDLDRGIGRTFESALRVARRVLPGDYVAAVNLSFPGYVYGVCQGQDTYTVTLLHSSSSGGGPQWSGNGASAFSATVRATTAALADHLNS